ncbi:MAG TPA: hypothetical protein VKA08_13085 [Balneolales bacterium]|nr:hypothetical protein [Balneolales bacterium]
MKRLSVYIILIIAAILIAGCDILGSSGDPAGMQKIGLNGYGISGIYVDGNQIIVGTSSVGSINYIFRSKDSGASWQQRDSIHVNNKLPYNFNVAVTQLHIFNNEGTLFAGIGDAYRGKVLMSTDNGKTWTEPDPGFTENVNCFTMINGTLFAGTDHGVFMTTNNGNSWSAADTVELSHPVVGLVSLTGDLFAATSGEGIYRSSDDGASWKEVNSTNYDFTGLATLGTSLFAGASKFYGKDSTGGVFISTDKGKNWSHADTGITDHDVYQLYSNSSDLFAGSNHGIYYSGNKGASWALLDSAGAVSFASNGSWLFIGDIGISKFPLSQLGK